MRFLADMGISPQTVAFLRGLGHDAVHLADLGRHDMPDGAVLHEAGAHDQIVLTHDLDFGELLAVSGLRLPTVIIFRLRNMHPKQVNRYLTEVIENHCDSLKRGAVITVTEGQIRVRLLPLETK